MGIMDSIQRQLQSQSNQATQSFQNQELANQQTQIKEQEFEKYREPLNMVGGELLRESGNKLGARIAKSTGIKAFENIGETISKKGLSGGLTQALARGQSEFTSKVTNTISKSLPSPNFKINPSTGKMETMSEAFERQKSDLQEATSKGLEDYYKPAVPDNFGDVFGDQDLPNKLDLSDKQIQNGKSNLLNKLNNKLTNEGDAPLSQGDLDDNKGSSPQKIAQKKAK